MFILSVSILDKKLALRRNISVLCSPHGSLPIWPATAEEGVPQKSPGDGYCSYGELCACW
jgi:hypothetical protein